MTGDSPSKWRPDLVWSVPWRRHFRNWNRTFRYGLRMPWLTVRWTALAWYLLIILFADALRRPWGAILIVSVPGSIVVLIYLLFPQANLGLQFWWQQLTRSVPILLMLILGPAVLIPVFCLMSLFPDQFSIRGHQLTHFSSSSGTEKRFDLLESRKAHVIIQILAGDVEYTLWLVFDDVARSFPLHPNVDPDRLRQLLPCPLTVDDRRPIAPTSPFAG